MYTCMHMPKLDRHAFVQTLVILQRLCLIWGHSDLLLCAKMLIYISEDLAVEALAAQPCLPCVSPAITGRCNNTL